MIVKASLRNGSIVPASFSIFPSTRSSFIHIGYTSAPTILTFPIALSAVTKTKNSGCQHHGA